MRSKYAHKLVASVAAGLAGAIYDEAAKNNEWYKLNPNRGAFINRVAPDLVMQARSTLVDLLARPDVSEEEKAEIYDALMKDAALPRNRGETMH